MSKGLSVSDIKKYAFIYGDTEYFEWFRHKAKGDCNDEHLKSVMQWKGLHRIRKKKFKDLIKKIWDKGEGKINLNKVDSMSIVTRAFLHHLQEPTKYPILDVNVFKAMRELNKGKANKTNKHISNWGKDYEKGYTLFFNNLYNNFPKGIQVPTLDGVLKEITKRRILDRALWEYGRIVSNNKKKKKKHKQAVRN